MLHRSSLHWVAKISMALVLIASRSPTALAESPASEQPFAPHPLARIEPGVQIVDRAPPGWSHLVIKSQPKVTAGDVAKVPDMTVRLVGMFFTAILMKVERQPAVEPPQYRLATAAIGMGTRVRDKDLIVSSETYRSLGANLGLIGGIVLSKSEEQFNHVIEVARSPTMVVADAPTVLARGAQHVQVMLRYAFLADPRDGRCYTLIWILDKDGAGGYRLGNTPLVLMKPNLVTDCEMRVDASKFSFGTPSPDAFAVLRMPPGAVLEWPAGLRTLAAERQFTPGSAYRLEMELWKAAFSPHQ
jgi:hypothetical protein